VSLKIQIRPGTPLHWRSSLIVRTPLRLSHAHGKAISDIKMKFVGMSGMRSLQTGRIDTPWRIDGKT
jgi:hypothetical protein